jgi:type IV secretion system protein VirB10
MSTIAPVSDRDAAEALKLRAGRPPVTRISRKVLIGLGAVSSVAVISAVAYAMSDHRAGKAAQELYSVGGPPPERLNALPKDYGAAPPLGPPLPGDLGRPIVAAGAPSPAIAQVPEAGASTAAQEAQAARQRLAQERDSARTSRLFASDARGSTVAGPTSIGIAAADLTQAAGAAIAGRQTVLDGPVDRRTTSPDRLQSPPSPYVVQAGAVIPAALVTGIRSDLPGQIVGQVTQDVYDSPTGRFLLIPQGARLIGVYDNQVAFGQNRVLLAWTRLILPSGRSLVLEKLPAGDTQGYAGLQDKVDRHWSGLLGMAALSTILGIGAELGNSDDEDDIVRAIRQGAVGTLNQVGQQAVGRGLSVPPTLTVRPGAPVRVIVTRDLVLEPYRK